MPSGRVSGARVRICDYSTAIASAGEVQPAASGAAALVGKVNGGHEASAWVVGRLDGLVPDGVEHELCPTEHGERVVLAEVAPREIHEPLASLALDRRPSEIEMAVAFHDLDVHEPTAGGGITGHEIDRLAADLNADMHVVARLAIDRP